MSDSATGEGRIVTRHQGNVLRVLIDRPAKANALTEAMLTELRDAALGARDAAVVVFTGAGQVFSGGADLAAARAGLPRSPLWEEVSGAVASLPGLTIAAINGTCAGGAMGMAMACDLRIAVPGASFFYPVARLGFLPPPSDPWRLAALVGSSRAKLILLGGARPDAEEARRFGLVDRVVDDLEAEVTALSRDAISAPRGHIAAIKALTPGMRR